MASVLLLLPDELLAEIDAIRPDGPRLEWIREALRRSLTMAQNQAAVANAQAGRRPSYPGRPVRRDLTGTDARRVTRQGTLPGGAVCAHPFRDDQEVCQNCGQRR